MSQAKLEGWLACDLSGLDLLAIQTDGMVVAEPHADRAERGPTPFSGIDSQGEKHPLAVMEGATGNAAVLRALIADLKDRGPADDRAFLWLIDGAKALTDHLGKLALIQHCQIHKARWILERLPPHLRARTSKALRQAFKAENEEVGKKPLDNLARRLDQEADGVAGAIREGMDDRLTCLGLLDDLGRSLVSTNQIENLIDRVRQLGDNVRRRRDVRMVKRRMVSAMIEAKKGMRRLRRDKSLPILQAPPSPP